MPTRPTRRCSGSLPRAWASTWTASTTATIDDVPNRGGVPLFVGNGVRPSNPFPGGRFYSTLFHEYGAHPARRPDRSDLPLSLLWLTRSPPRKAWARPTGYFRPSSAFPGRAAGVNPEQAAALKLGKLEQLRLAPA